MQAFYNGSDMKKADQHAIQEEKIPSVALMDAAAASLAQQVRLFLHHKTDARILILCGKNNNGGDGFCAARFLTDYCVTIALCYPEGSTLSPDAQTYQSVARAMNIPMKNIYGKTADELSHWFSQFDVIVDAIYGTGFSGQMRYACISDIITAANLSGVPIISADVPSGADATSGSVADSCIMATQTVTFAALKTGLLLYPAYTHCGKIISVNIGMPKQSLSSITPAGFVVDDAFVKESLPKRFTTSHKTSYGKAICLGGSASMKGSILLTSQSAMRMGVGLVKLASTEAVCTLSMMQTPELLTMPLITTDDGYIAKENSKALLTEESGYTAVAIGPGMGHTEDTKEILTALLKKETPLLIDADALNALADNTSLLKAHAGEAIITPHEMEMARLIKKDAAYVRENRISVAKNFAKEYDCIVVLKGAHTLIATPQNLYMILTGNPGMSTAGSGDVLAGMIVGLLAQNIPADIAAILGAYLHGACGDSAAKKVGYMALNAHDITAEIAKVLLAFSDENSDG